GQSRRFDRFRHLGEDARRHAGGKSAEKQGFHQLLILFTQRPSRRALRALLTPPQSNTRRKLDKLWRNPLRNILAVNETAGAFAPYHSDESGLESASSTCTQKRSESLSSMTTRDGAS